MEEANVNSSQESLLPFSQETYNFLFNILGQEENGLLLTGINDLSEIALDPPPPVQTARSSLPATADWPGEIGFNVTFGTPDKNLTNPSWVYSEKDKKLFVKKDAPCPINFSTSFLVPTGLVVRAMAIYTSPEHASEAFKRCLTHVQLEEGKAEVNHVIRSESIAAQYEVDIVNNRHSVVIPFENPPAGQTFSTYIYKFVCFSSCAGGANRRPLTLVFTLEQNNVVIGRRSLNLKICSTPGRDSVEKVPKAAAPSCSKKLKMDSKMSPQAMLPRTPEITSKKRPKGKGKNFRIETNDVGCYNFLTEMKRMYYFNQKLAGLPDEYKVFFQLLRVSSSEDERSQDEDQGGLPSMKQ